MVSNRAGRTTRGGRVRFCADVDVYDEIEHTKLQGEAGPLRRLVLTSAGPKQDRVAQVQGEAMPAGDSAWPFQSCPAFLSRMWWPAATCLCRRVSVVGSPDRESRRTNTRSADARGRGNGLVPTMRGRNGPTSRRTNAKSSRSVDAGGGGNGLVLTTRGWNGPRSRRTNAKRCAFESSRENH
ncbi:hypothetical protein EXIGLDRAFT_40049 [Exidia glandulosa HHB12029]|uniref:Uncharacterized protein n=1 Tax=Exidia glandulosa HHB12029 TaxID=1314781 RepID=A0A165INW6_EXIGL|nr:hypothetical protein EXIGLDRAFT_40049 [Exidia glandulosa HHB12029]